jgi:hypothetical protein
MPRKKGWRTPDEIREKIQGSLIINRLQDHVVGDVEMTPSQVNAAKTLLGKVIPDLKAVEHSGDPENPMNHQHQMVERRIVDPSDRDA